MTRRTSIPRNARRAAAGKNEAAMVLKHLGAKSFSAWVPPCRRSSLPRAMKSAGGRRFRDDAGWSGRHQDRHRRYIRQGSHRCAGRKTRPAASSIAIRGRPEEQGPGRAQVDGAARNQRKSDKPSGAPAQGCKPSSASYRRRRMPAAKVLSRAAAVEAAGRGATAHLRSWAMACSRLRSATSMK